MKSDFNEENLVTFPASKNFPIKGKEDDFLQEMTEASANDPIEELMAEIEQMELEFTNRPQKTTERELDQLDRDLDFNDNLDFDILNHRVFPNKHKLKKSIGHIKQDPTYIGKSSDLDQVLKVMRQRVNELKEANQRTRYYLNEIKINQK